MISSRMLPVCFFTSVLFCLFSCNGSETSTGKTGGDTSATAAASTPAATTAPAPVSSIIHTPQLMMLVKHKVANYAKWKASYDAHDSMRLASGLHSYVIGRNPNDSNLIFVAVKADDAGKAKSFAANPSLKAAMQKGGVIGKPSISFVTVSFQDTAVMTSTLRSMTTFSVKDWNAWEKAFAEGGQERLDNGIVARAYGYDVDNNNKVTLVTAITDTAKAQAYWKSDMLKKRREAGGVIGEPERFLYQVVQRYR